MSIKKDYEIKLDTLRAIPDDQIKIPNNIPLGVYVQEADNLHHWCRADKETLTKVGLSWTLVKDLPIRAGALREAEARWNTQRFSRKQAVEKWEKESRTAYDLRNELLQSLRFAYRKHTELSKTVNAIGKGQGHADMIQDLNDLSLLGKGNPEPLSEINFDMSLLDKAAETAQKMARLLAEVNRERNQLNEAKQVRDQAFTHLKEAVDEIYEYGQFAFRDDQDRRKGYRSYYMFMRRRKHERKFSSPVPVTDEEALTPDDGTQTTNEGGEIPERIG